MEPRTSMQRARERRVLLQRRPNPNHVKRTVAAGRSVRSSSGLAGSSRRTAGSTSRIFRVEPAREAPAFELAAPGAFAAPQHVLEPVA